MSKQSTEKTLRLLISVGQRLSQTTDLNELFDRILDAARQIFRFENAIIRLIDDERQVLVTAAGYGYSAEAADMEIPVGQGIIGRVAASGKTLLVSDLHGAPDYIPGIEGARSELAVPLLGRDKVIGVFNVESPEPGAFDATQIDLLSTLASQAAIAIENARLYDRLHRMSQRYQELHQLNERILRSVNLGIYTVDRKLVITSWNRRMEEMSGVLAADAVGNKLITRFPNLVREGIMERVRNVLESGQSEKLQLTHRTMNGKERTQKRRLAPLRDGDKVTGVVVLVEDVTEFKRLLDQTIRSEKLAEVGRMSAGVAHEINNPLSVIGYAAELLLREEGLPVLNRELVEQIASETERLKSLTGSLLSFARSNETILRPTDLNGVIRDVLRLIRFELRRNSITIEEECADELPEVLADADKLKQVLINLLMNSGQAIGQQGRIRIISRWHNGAVEMSIADNGPGIPAAIREQIFEPFFTSRADGKGTGLGLYICHNIISEHSGRLLLEENADGGATFRIILPVLAVPQNRSAREIAD